MAIPKRCVCGAARADGSGTTCPHCGREHADFAMADATVASQVASARQYAAAESPFDDGDRGADDPLSFRDDDVGLAPRRPYCALAPIPTIMAAGFLGGPLGGFAAIALSRA